MDRPSIPINIVLAIKQIYSADFGAYAYVKTTAEFACNGMALVGTFVAALFSYGLLANSKVNSSGRLFIDEKSTTTSASVGLYTTK